MRLNLWFSLLFVFAVPCYAGEAIPDFSDNSVAVLNTELRNLDLDNQITQAGRLNLNNKKIENLATPTSSTDAATKGYVDARLLTGSVQSKSADTVYLASTDVFVTAYSDYVNAAVTLTAISDAASPPTVVMNESKYDASGMHRANVSMYVKKGNYWTVSASGVGVTATINAIPLGN